MQEIYESIKKSALMIKSAIEFSDTQYSKSKNKTGDTQLKLDILGDKIIEEEFRKIKSIKAIISEEQELQTPLHKEGKYIIAYDPIDGSSLIDVNLSVGSIFGIYENKIGGEYLKAAVYVVYGPRCELVIAEEKVTLYRLNEDQEFTEIKQIKLKEKGNINASGATQKGWSSYHKKMIDDIFQDGYRLRYSGGMVPDLHQVLLKGGGLFSYPGTSDAPNGKLRKLFEVFPFAFIFEKAGGGAIDGKVRLLTLSSKNIHETTPCFFGSHEEIKRVKDVYAKQ